MDYLDFDLNEVATKAIQDRIESLETETTTLAEGKLVLSKENKELKSKLSDATNANYIAKTIKQTYASITKTEETDDSYAESATENKYNYIKSIMLTLYGIKEEYSYYGECLWRNLAINYYNYKDELISILKLVEKDGNIYSGTRIKQIEEFRMPIDYTKAEIMEYVKNPHYCTNGCVYGVGEFYMRSDNNTPHDLFQVNKYILDNDVFEEIIKTILTKKSYYYYLYSIPKYINLPKDKLKILGETLIEEESLKFGVIGVIKEFVTNNLKFFSEETLEYLYSKITDKNQYKVLHWEKFPVKYQHRHLMDKDIEKILKIITGYSCEWTLDEKNEFLKMYYAKEPSASQ